MLAAATEEATEGELIFVGNVLPMLKTKCFACHGGDPEGLKGELDLLTRDGLLRGGESGEPAMVPGKPEESPLYLASNREPGWSTMPPKENDALDTKQRAGLKRWIELGAPWPDEQRLAEVSREYEQRWTTDDGIRVATSGGLDPDWTLRRYDPAELWALQPLTPVEPPSDDAAVHPVDAFLNAKLQEQSLVPAPLADRTTLIRRATFDLIGLPPTVSEVEAFLADPEGDDVAFARLVDRLLDSPHYGEKWGRHWLDVTRYADSSGFANDYERGNAWRYRDYVVRAFNDDRPYDQFVREQIAGDEIDPDDPEKLVATGFLRMGPWELTGMEVAKVARQRFLDDATDAIGQTFLGTMLQCASCHDHKFDPIPTRDYYAIQAALGTTQLAERAAPFLDSEAPRQSLDRELLLKRRQHYQAELAELNEKQIAGARQWLSEEKIDSKAFEQALAQSPGNFGGVRNRLRNQGIDEAEIPPRLVGWDEIDQSREKIARKGLQRLSWSLDRDRPYALSVYTGYTPNLTNVHGPLRIPDDLTKGQLEQTAILTGGDPFSPAQPVWPGLLSATVGVSLDGDAPSNGVLPEDQVRLLPPDEKGNAPLGGRRLALANWIASAENPLTARVMVNRIWQGHFGQAIAGNPNNFGSTGKKPTHPQLLDWLALRFIENGWSVKQIHRLVMTSEAYRRASSHPEPESLAERDPQGTTYVAFQPRRLTAEEIRDAALAVSGELNLAVGGVPIRPEINLEVAMQPRLVMGTLAEAWQPSPTPDLRNRRSIYIQQLRGLREPLLEIMNAPSPDLSTETRDASTVTPQVFALFNGQQMHRRALAMAARLAAEHRSANQEEVAIDQAAVIHGAFLLAFSREPTAAEQEACLAHWKRLIERHARIRLQPDEYPKVAIREGVEEMTGKRFEVAEPLEVMEHYVPDPHPADFSPEIRALADLCLVLLNTNEFMYIY